MPLEKRRTLMKAFVEPHHKSCLLIWMLHSSTLNNKISSIQEKALRILYSGHNSSFNELLQKDGSFTTHQRNVQSLAIEIYKYLHGLSPSTSSELFKVNETIIYDLRVRNESKTVNYTTEKYDKIRFRIFLSSKNNGFDTTKYKRFELLAMLLKKH